MSTATTMKTSTSPKAIRPRCSLRPAGARLGDGLDTADTPIGWDVTCVVTAASTVGVVAGVDVSAGTVGVIVGVDVSASAVAVEAWPLARTISAIVVDVCSNWA